MRTSTSAAVTGQAADILGLAVSGLGGEQHLVVVKQAPDRTLLLFGDHHTDAVNALDQGLGVREDGEGILPWDGILIIQELSLQPATDQLRVSYLT